MSSILEALRELESQQPPATQSVAATEPPSVVNRSMATAGIIAIGLAVGALVFGLGTWLFGLVPALFSRVDAPVRTAPVSVAPKPLAPPAPPAPPEPEAPTAARPTWLETADPPRALVGAATSGTSEPATRSASERPRPVVGRVMTDGAVEVAAIHYSPDVTRRSVALRLEGGDVVTLREHQSAHGIEVQLIESDGVYVRRGGDVSRLTPAGVP